jgi:hypothetical protein
MIAKAKPGLKFYNAEDFGIYKADFQKLLEGQEAEVPGDLLLLYPNLFEAVDVPVKKSKELKNG